MKFYVFSSHAYHFFLVNCLNTKLKKYCLGPRRNFGMTLAQCLSGLCWGSFGLKFLRTFTFSEINLFKGTPWDETFSILSILTI